MSRKTTLAAVLACLSFTAFADDTKVQSTTIQSDTATSTTQSGSVSTDKATVGVSPSVNSQGKGGGVEFGRLDVNLDGNLSEDELSANTSITGKLSDMDKDGDGKVTRGEFAAFQAHGEADASTSTTGTSSSSTTTTEEKKEEKKK